MNQLAFNDAEIAELFLKLHHRTLKKETVAALYNKTEGWIVGLRIVLLAIREIEDADQIIANLQGDSYSLSRYLIEEVIAQRSSGYRIYY